MVFLTFVGCTSCATGSYLFGPGNLFRDKRRSFIKIDIYKSIFISKTSTTSNIEQYELELNSSASGFIVGQEREITLIATSAHVCSIMFGDQVKYFIPDYSPKDPSWKLKETASFIMNDYRGRSYTAIPIKFDLESDICVLGSSKISLPVLMISQSPPIIGEKYYNIAAPMGVWSSKMIPLFEGFFLGLRKTSYAFSIPTKGGSSGSPIINKYGEVVAAVHSSYRGFENLCIATTNNQIFKVYRKSIQRLRKDYDKYKLIIDLINI